MIDDSMMMVDVTETQQTAWPTAPPPPTYATTTAKRAHMYDNMDAANTSMQEEIRSKRIRTGGGGRASYVAPRNERLRLQNRLSCAGVSLGQALALAGSWESADLDWHLDELASCFALATHDYPHLEQKTVNDLLATANYYGARCASIRTPSFAWQRLWATMYAFADAHTCSQRETVPCVPQPMPGLRRAGSGSCAALAGKRERLDIVGEDENMAVCM
jgi:hypothetical protein